MRYYSRTLHAAVFALFGILLLPVAAHAKRQFCVNIRYLWDDANVGEDYQAANPAGAWANRVWLDLQRDGQTIWSGYADSGATSWPCTPSLSASAGTYVLWTTMAFQPKPNTNVWIWKDAAQEQAGQWTWYSKNFGALPASTGGAFTMHTMNIGYQFTSVWSTTNVGAVVSRLGLNLDFGLVANNTYGIYAEQGGGSGWDGSRVLLGYDSQSGWHYRSKWTIGHELGHAVEDLLVGVYSDAANYDDAPNEPTCECDYVAQSKGSLRNNLCPEGVDAPSQQGARSRAYWSI
jgi:hypothetical protein